MKTAALFCVVLAGMPAQAATIAVTSTSDLDAVNGDCTLREALRAAQGDTAIDTCSAGNGADVVEVPAGTYAISAALAIGANTRIRGAGAGTVIRPGSAPLGVTAGQVIIEDLVIDGGANGGLVAADADVTLRRCGVTDVTGGAGALSLNRIAAGARPILRLEDTTISGTTGTPAIGVVAGSVTVVRSAFIDNAGGGIVARGDVDLDTLVLQNSTFSGNSVGGSGGAIAVFVPSSIENCTFVGNSAAVEGGAMVIGAVMAVRNSVFIDNSAPAGASCVDLVGASFSVGDNTIDDDVDCPMDGSGDIIDGAFSSPAVFGPLADNGGYTPTLSPLKDGRFANGIIGNASRCVGVDQRGATRDIATCDRGAVEVGGVFLSTVLAVAIEPVGVHCGRGGHRLAAGLDDGAGTVGDAGDGLLSGAEEDSVSFLCEDLDPSTLVVVEDDDGTCPAGGVQMHSGVDDDDDGILDLAERDRTDHLCNGEAGDRGPGGADGPAGSDGSDGTDGSNGGSGFSSLLRTSVVDAGDEGCTAGGQRIEGGLDDGAGGESAGDGVLGDGEVDATAILCNGASFEDEFETTGGPSCASVRAPLAPVWGLATVLLVRGRRRRDG